MTGGGRRAGLALRLVSVLVGGFLVAPVFVVVPLGFTDKDSFEFPPSGWSLRYHVRFFTDPAWVEPLLTSLAVAVMVTLTATATGTLAAFAITRLCRGRAALQGLLLAPMIVPNVVVALAIYAAFLSWGLVGTVEGLVLAHAVLALPFVVITVGASLRTLDVRLERAAASLGASPFATFRRITLPLIAPGVMSGAVFAFVTSFDEAVISLYLQSPHLRTLPVQMFTSVSSDVDPTIAAGSTVILVVTTALILLPDFVKRRTS
ncbi:ABC transporter permease [Nonomuraea helvata]|uniref:ABC transporter permease n=1 Tax=Nonomuraea helvata TaxID=37484 RepID=A0ABV5S9H7_9ACTN